MYLGHLQQIDERSKLEAENHDKIQNAFIIKLVLKQYPTIYKHNTCILSKEVLLVNVLSKEA